MVTISLNGTWKARDIKNDSWFDAEVPGTILGSMVEENLAMDPYYRDNERKSRDLFKQEYEYKRTFSVDENTMSKEHVELVCYGLDTLADIYVNQALVASTDNMHRTYRIDIKKHIRLGINHIHILFHSAVEHVSKHNPTPGKEVHYVPSGCREGNQTLRKSHSSFGWNFAPQLPDCGIWRDIELEAYDVRISRLSVGQNFLDNGIEVVSYVKIDGLPIDPATSEVKKGQYALLAKLTGPYEYSAETDCEIRRDGTYVLKILVEQPQLWWPNGYGAQPLYSLTVRLLEREQTFSGQDIERYVSHNKVFERYDEGKDTSAAFAGEKYSFADSLGIVPIATDVVPIVEEKAAQKTDKARDVDNHGAINQGEKLAEDDEWFSARAAIGGSSGGRDFFDHYSGHSEGKAIGHDSDEGLFSIAIDETYGHLSDELGDEKFSSEIGMGPFDNRDKKSNALFDGEFSTPIKRLQEGTAPAKSSKGQDAETEVRKYEKAQKSVFRSAAVSIKDEKTVRTDVADAGSANRAPAHEPTSKTEDVKQGMIRDENGKEREMTAAELMLQRMLVRKDESKTGKNSESGNYVHVIQDMSKVAHVSISEDEEDLKKEEEALKAISFKGTNDHKSAGQTVVSDTDTVMWTLDVQKLTIGLRSIYISQEQDEFGEEFAFCVNGVKIFARGGNYVPMDAISGWVSLERLEYLIKDCVSSNFNCIRVWGGGYYPGDEFYELCDRYGIIVWQDVMFAENIYDLTDSFKATVEAELHDNLRRIHHHACLGLICGNGGIEAAWEKNEDFEGHSIELKNDYLKLFEKLIPEVINDEAPETFYWPSSPSSFGSFRYPDDKNHGDAHYWDMWHGQKFVNDFEKYHYRFVSELGFQSYPDIRTLDSFTRETDRNLFSKMMDFHQKDPSGNNKLFFYISEQFLFPKDYESGIYVSQALQGLAIKKCVDHLRRNRGRCMGALYWQINDCWPGISWSGIDYFGRWKALQYMAARFFAPVAGSIKREGRVFSAYLQNETMNPVRYKVTMNLKDMEFNVIDSVTTDEIIVDALSVKEMISRDYTKLSAGKSGSQFVEVEFLDLSTGNIMLETDTIIPYKSLKLENPEIGVFIMEDPEKFSFYLQASRFAPFVELYLKDMDAVFGDNFFHMTKKEHLIVLYKQNFKSDGVTVDDLKERLIIRSLYDSYSYD